MKAIITFCLFTTAFSACTSHKTHTPAEIKRASPAWLGKWERDIRSYGATLEITDTSNDSIYFSLTASSGGATGELEEVAIVKDSVAIYSNNDPDSCFIQFKLRGDSVIVIDEQYGDCEAGIGVSYDGVYRNSKKTPTKLKKEENLVNLQMLDSPQQDSAFRRLVGDSYDLFVNATQLTSEAEDLDSLHAKVRSSGINGLFTLMENIIMIDSSNNIWAAVIDDKKVYYFTTSKDYKQRLPKTIEDWRQRFKDYDVIYK